MKILVADDSTFMRTILKDLLGQSKWAGTEIVEASNGDEAVAAYQAGKPDLVLLDIVMPGKDGIAVLKEIGFSAPSVVIVSSMGQDSVINEAKSLGAKDYIVKPFDAPQVVELLNKLFDATSSAEPSAATSESNTDPNADSSPDQANAA